MKKFIYGLIMSLSILFAAGCGEHIVVNGNSYRILSEQEEKEMLRFARITLLQNEKLTLAQQNYIKKTEPQVRLSYTGNKTGRASYQWICDDAVMVKVNCDGKFLSSDMNVNTRKTNLQETIKKGEKSSLEKLTLKEIEY